MPIGADFTIAVNGDIRHTSGTTNYTVLELHRWLQDLADDELASGNDIVDITSFTPSDRSTDNIITLLDHSGSSGPTYNVDDNAAEFLYDGSITQQAGNTVYSGLQVLGSVNNTATQLMIIQDNGLYQFTTTPSAPFWGTQGTGGYNGNAAANILMQLCIKSRVNGADINNQVIRVQARHWGDSYDFFNVNLGQGVSVAAIGTTPDAQNTTAQGTVTVYADVLNSGGTANAPTGGFQNIDLNNGNGAQPYYSQWTYGAQGDGLKALWEYGKDLTGNGTSKTIDSLGGELFLGITHSVAYDGEAGGPFVERETVVWGTKFFYDALVSGPFTPGNYVTIGSSGAAGRVLFDDGVDELTVALENTTITLLDNDVVTEFSGPGAGATSTTAAINTGGGAITDNGVSGGSGLLLALDDQGVTGTLWFQILTGVAPVDNLPLRGITSGATALVNVTVTSRTVPKVYLGSYTGTLIGAYGVGVDPNDLTSNDTIEDLLGITQTPPNNVTFTVTGLVSGEDRVLVAPRTGVVIDTALLTLSTNLTTGTEVAVVCTGAIPTDSPTTGTLRVINDSTFHKFLTYTSYTSATFTITSAVFNGVNEDDSATNPKDVYVTYIDKLAGAASEAFTTVYVSDRDLFVRVRDGGATPIKTFESTSAILSSTGGSVGAIRTTDA